MAKLITFGLGGGGGGERSLTMTLNKPEGDSIVQL